MRSSKSRSRSKSNRNRPSGGGGGGNIVNRVFDSSGPEGKVRGTPQQIIDKYNQLTRDAQVSNDRVAAENFQQHAEHYLRLLNEAQREQEVRREEQERQNRERQADRDRERSDRAERQERVLIFTQFREIIEPIADYLALVFKRSGLILHGKTNVKKRNAIVNQFQEEDGPPFFILSLKAGGTGLNLTAASQVIHFDRWWNPAVENQATDRAFRIGQKRNVLVHKFVTRGTIEERIDAMIAEKQQLADEILSSTGEVNVTELPDEELLNLVGLDVTRATM